MTHMSVLGPSFMSITSLIPKLPRFGPGCRRPPFWRRISLPRGHGCAAGVGVGSSGTYAWPARSSVRAYLCASSRSLTLSRTLSAIWWMVQVATAPLGSAISMTKKSRAGATVTIVPAGAESAPWVPAIKPTAMRSAVAVTLHLRRFHQYHPRRILQRYRPAAIQFGDFPAQVQKLEAEVSRLHQLQERDVLAAGINASLSASSGDCPRL